MLRRITELWPQLLSGGAGNQANDDHDDDDDENVDKATEEQLEELRAQTKSLFKN